jgi:putative ABC transport system permease protein
MRWLERAALRLLPSSHRDRFGDDLCREWRALRAHERASGGRLAEWRYMLRELRSFVAMVRDTRASTPRATFGPGFGRDLRGALRRHAAHPGRALLRTLMLGAALAAPLVSFAVADAVLWRALPFQDPDRLVAVWERTGPVEAREPARVTGSRFVDWQRRATTLTGLAAFGAAGFQVDTGDGVTTLRGVRVSGGFFELLGVTPHAGRLISASDQAPGATPVVVLSHAYWRSHFGGRPVVGEPLRLSGQTATIIGVLPDVWLPAWPVNPAIIELDPALRQVFVPMPPASVLERNRASHLFGVLGRLREGVTVESARDELESLASADQPDPHGGVVVPLRTQMVSEARTPLLLLLGAALCVLLVAGLNVAALDVAAFESRTTEFRVRAALGAGTLTLSRQLFLEVFPIVSVAAVFAAVAARVSLTALASLMEERIPFVTKPALDASSIAVLIAVGLGTSMVMTVWPLWRIRRLGRLQVSGGGRTTTTSSRGLRLLIGGQFAGALALVLASTVLVQAFTEIGGRDPGFDPRNVQMLEFSLPRDRYATPEVIAAFERRLLERVNATPGVRAATISHDHPYQANWLDAATLTGGSTGAGDSRSQVQLRIVSPDYVEVMRARLVEGRAFDPMREAGDDGEVLVNEAFVRREGGGVGRLVTLSSPSGTWGDAVPSAFQIVGVLGDERFRGLEAATEPAVYVTTRQFPQRDLTLLARLDGSPSAVDLRALVREVEPGASRGAPLALDEVEREQRAPRTWLTVLVGTFASGALVLAATGLAGLLLLVVSAREREIGIRLALGAARSDVIRGVVTEALLPLAIGAAGGITLAVLAGRWMQSQVVQADLFSADTIVVAMLVLFASAVVATIVPARRAANIDPADAFRT